jgi:hypothetical protein
MAPRHRALELRGRSRMATAAKFEKIMECGPEAVNAAFRAANVTCSSPSTATRTVQRATN